jgi:RNA polymerase sigma-70 factor (ECF subfamily)
MNRDSPLSDLESRLRPLWLAAQSGDERAYREALGLMAKRLRAYFRRRMPTWQDESEDLVQETLLAVHMQRGTYDPDFPVLAWMTAMARHKLIDRWRRLGRRDALYDELDDMDESALATEEGEPHAARDLTRLMQSLPDAQRRAIALTKLEGLSVAEASAQTGVSEAALKVQVHRGIKRLADLVRKG